MRRREDLPIIVIYKIGLRAASDCRIPDKLIAGIQINEMGKKLRKRGVNN
jgi:hypothetical protein